MKKKIKSGIYKITNSVSKKFYVGSAKDINKRWCRHKLDLKNNKHHNIILQRAWNKYDSSNFIFEIIEECSIEKLFEKEQYYIDTLKPIYNISLDACGGDNLTNNPNRIKIIQKMTESIKKRFLNMTEEERKNLSEKCKGEKNSNFGNKWNDESRKNLSIKKKIFYENNSPINKGKKLEELVGEEKAKKIKENLSANAAKRTGEKNPFFGKKHKNETKEKWSDIRKGKYTGDQNIEFIIDGKEYRSLGEASKDLKIPSTTIRWRLKSKNKKYNNYKYKV